MHGRKVMAWLLFFQIACVECSFVLAEEIMWCGEPRFVQSDILELCMYRSGYGEFLGFYSISDDTFSPLSISTGGRWSAGSYSPELLANPPRFLWNMGNAVSIVAPDCTVNTYRKEEDEEDGLVTSAKAFPDKGLLLEKELPSIAKFSSNFRKFTYVLRDKNTGAAIDRLKTEMQDAPSPSFGKDGNFFMSTYLTWRGGMASLFSIKPLRKVSRRPFPRLSDLRYVYGKNPSELVAVGYDDYDLPVMSPGSGTRMILTSSRKYHFLRVRHTPEQAFQVEEFDSLVGAYEATWRNGLIWWCNSDGVTIEKRAPGKESQSVIVPYQWKAQRLDGVRHFIVNDDGTLLLIAPNAFFLNGSCAFELWKVDFPTVTCVGEYIMQWDKDEKVPKITKREKTEKPTEVSETK